MLSPYPFLCHPSSLRDKEKESHQPALGINLPSWNGLPGNPFPDCLPGIALKYSSSTVDVLPGTIQHLPEEQIKQVKLIHRSMWRQAQPIYVLVHPLLLQKQTYLISSGTRARVSHTMQSPCPFLCPCSYLQDKDKKKQYVGTSTQTSGKIPHMPEEQMRQVKLIHRSMWRQAQPIYVLVHPLLLQKQTYLISSGSTVLKIPA